MHLICCAVRLKEKCICMQGNAFCKALDIKKRKQFGGSSVMTYSLKGKIICFLHHLVSERILRVFITNCVVRRTETHKY